MVRTRGASASGEREAAAPAEDADPEILEGELVEESEESDTGAAEGGEAAQSEAADSTESGRRD